MSIVSHEAGQSEMSHFPLPEGYSYVDGTSIDPLEVTELFRSADLDEVVRDDQIAYRNEGFIQYGESWRDVGVRDAHGQLVGFGCLVYKESYGEFGDLAVDPDHRHQGIAKALVSERLRIADELGLTFITIPILEAANTLRTYYLENGFHEAEHGELHRGFRATTFDKLDPVEIPKTW